MLKFDTNWYAFAVSVADHKPVNIQGHHADHILVIVDEASGVANTIYEAIDGILISGSVAKLVMMGNPNYLQGRFYETFINNFDRTKTFTISAFDTPNFTENKITLNDIKALNDLHLLNIPRSYKEIYNKKRNHYGYHFN